MGSLCCNAHQIDVIVAVCAYTVLILGTWRVDAVVMAQFVLLFVTTYVSVFSVYDIYDDCVRRYVNDSQTKSDAVVCAQLCPICPARGWGVVWLVISLGLWAGGVCYLVLHVGGHLDL